MTVLFAAMPTGRAAVQAVNAERMYIPLPATGDSAPLDPDVTEQADLRNSTISDLHLLGVLVGGRLRFVYTTEGFTDDNDQPSNPAAWDIYTGRLRYVDLTVPVPDVGTFTSNDGMKYPPTLGVPAVVQWILRLPVSN